MADYPQDLRNNAEGGHCIVIGSCAVIAGVGECIVMRHQPRQRINLGMANVVLNTVKPASASLSSKKSLAELSEAEIDMVSGGLEIGGPGFGISTAFFFAGAEPGVVSAPGILQLPDQAAPSPNHVGLVAGGLVTAKVANPSGR
jgi:hypothetical protein